MTETDDPPAETDDDPTGTDYAPADADWTALLVATERDWEAAVDLRMRVFVDEQGVPEELELDEHDADPLESAVDHLLVREGSQRAEAATDTATGAETDSGSDSGANDASDGPRPAGEAVAVARLRPVDAADYGAIRDETDRVAKVERVVVARDRRGEGWGARVMRALEARARARGLFEAVLHAQTQAAGFYERLGYAVDDAVGTFEEDGIEHVRMRRSL